MKLSTLFLSALPVAIAAPAPIIVPRAGAPIPGKYIVKLQIGNFQLILDTALAILGKEATYVYKFGDFGGFAAEMSDTVANLIRKVPGVEYVEQDAIVQANLGQHDSPEKEAYVKKAYVTQSSSTWGLGRISHALPGISTYTYDNSAGAGTCAYVIDTGIEVSHPEFEGRAVFLANYAGDSQSTDGNGHGTHVAGTIGSKTYGVAKKTKLYAVKVLGADGSGSNSGVIAGINYVANDAKTRGCTSAVANLSLGGSRSSAVNSAAANAVTAGVFMAVAAGNSYQDASTSSPASESSVFTVGATDASDTFASFSNYGSFVDILAPGVNILSTWINGGTATISGTSMASPHVAGLAVYLLAFEGKRTPAALTSRLRTLSLKNKIKSVPSGTTNSLAFNGNPSG